MEQLKIYELEENKLYSAEELKKVFEENKQYLNFENYYKEQIKSEFVLLNPSKVVTISGYPYGYLKTLVRYSLLNNNYGSCMVFQSQNPKSLIWNKPKKSTYNDIGFLVITKEGHISTISLSFNDGESKNKAWEDLLPFMTKEQKIKYANIHGYTETMKHVTFSIKPQYFKHRETGRIITSVNMFDLNKVDKCTEEGVLIDEEKEKEDEKKKEAAINNNIQYESITKYKELKKEGVF